MGWRACLLSVQLTHAILLVPYAHFMSFKPTSLRDPMMAISSAKRVIKERVARYTRQIEAFNNAPCDEECATAVQLLREMRAEGLPLPVHAQTKTMLLCTCQLQVVEALFEELVAAGVPTEGTYAALIRSQVACGARAAALQTLTKLMDDERWTVRLRTCAPLLSAFCEADEQEQAVALWRRLKSHGIVFTTVEYGSMLHMLSRSGNAVEMWRVLCELLTVHGNPDEETINMIRAAVVNFAGDDRDAFTLEETFVTERGEVFLQPVAHTSHTEAVEDSEATMGEKCGQLQLLRLSEEQREAVRSVLLERAAGRSSSSDHKLLVFDRWLSHRQTFDYVVDGPNVAYCNQNYVNGSFSYRQVGALVDHLRKAGKRVLLVLPRKYTRRTIPNHTCSPERTTTLSDADMALLEEWRRSDALFECPNGVYDDWYWMYASVASPEAVERTVIVTNDAMRDHWVELLPRVQFSRWRQSQIVEFRFRSEEADTDQALDECVNDGEGGAHDEAVVTRSAGEVALESELNGAKTDAKPVAAVTPPAQPTATSDATDAQLAGNIDNLPSADEQTSALGDSSSDSRPAPRLLVWVADVPHFSVEAQQDCNTWHVPLPSIERQWIRIMAPPGVHEVVAEREETDAI
mmetsp:Transcript_18488/g.46315  ORF Transcript_18488/g.46315 Transcript_18488/m.46315 type:complete len:633 (-) Transcript_18488:458-2356(-)